MPGVQQIPNVGALTLANVIQAYIAGSKLRLFVSGYIPGPGDTLANLEAVECTFSGYPAGGYSLATWQAAVLSLLGGAETVCPQQAVQYVAPGSGSGVSNIVGGWFLVDTGGNLIADGTFDSPVGLAAPGDGFPISVSLILGSLNALAQCWIYGNNQ